MILGNKSDIAKVLPYVGEGLQKALAYIAATDFAHIENGEYEIDGRNVFARVNTYETEPKAERRSEKHNDYIDVQFVARGEEEIWFAPLEEKYVVTEDLSEENDVLFYANPGEVNSVKLSEG
ncbi:MAG: YhcH/YjgK/YiaL family protein, partial [Phascolarctobacterium sp.]|nr:YhcH/YjgK/YiaL family protein [Phascolarctobacterium sp.]